MPTWKKVFLRSAGFGAGFAVALAVMIGIFAWNESRPKPPRPWDASAIKAKYYRVSTSSDSQLEFEYILENTTDLDYKLEEYSGARIAGRLGDTGGFVGFGDKENIKLEVPVYIPAHNKTRITVKLPAYGYEKRYPGNTATQEEIHAYYVGVAEHVSAKLANLNGFSIFDDGNRYQIDLPNGWKSVAEEETKRRLAEASSEKK